MPQVTFYDPFLDILGGGEKVLLTILADVAAAPDNDVTILSPHRPEPGRWRRLGIDVAGRRLRWRAATPLSATPLSAGADLFVTLTNHFPPLSLARRSAAIVQYPFAVIRGEGPVEALRSIDRRARLRSYDSVLCYSDYVAGAIRERLGVGDPIVIPPPVDLPAQAPPGEREPMILAVGRFFAPAEANNKRHDVLIDAWRELEPQAPGWDLHLVGGVHDDPASLRHVAQLRRRAEGLRVHFHLNADAAQLSSLYRRGALFWHAAGYGEVLPGRLEHFGITTVEAMAHGCVPVVVGLGGQLEVVRDGRNGRLWATPAELVATSRRLIEDPAEAARLRAAAVTDARRFATERFLARVREAVLEPAGVPHP